MIVIFKEKRDFKVYCFKGGVKDIIYMFSDIFKLFFSDKCL